mmetsp:Transcript_36258/g.89215  ORF Transcript_36258/g.89215 Transcript_36258/m.89215 type:complete len:280 (+) Transcript_36258:858-1697(+)
MHWERRGGSRWWAAQAKGRPSKHSLACTHLKALPGSSLFLRYRVIIAALARRAWQTRAKGAKPSHQIATTIPAPISDLSCLSDEGHMYSWSSPSCAEGSTLTRGQHQCLRRMSKAILGAYLTGIPIMLASGLEASSATSSRSDARSSPSPTRACLSACSPSGWLSWFSAGSSLDASASPACSTASMELAALNLKSSSWSCEQRPCGRISQDVISGPCFCSRVHARPSPHLVGLGGDLRLLPEALLLHQAPLHAPRLAPLLLDRELDLSLLLSANLVDAR